MEFASLYFLELVIFSHCYLAFSVKTLTAKSQPKYIFKSYLNLLIIRDFSYQIRLFIKRANPPVSPFAKALRDMSLVDCLS